MSNTIRELRNLLDASVNAETAEAARVHAEAFGEMLAYSLVEGEELEISELEEMTIAYNKRMSVRADHDDLTIVMACGGVAGKVLDYRQHRQVSMPDGRVACAGEWDYSNVEPGRVVPGRPGYRLRFWTGPLAVKSVVEAIREGGHEVTEGTEGIWVEWAGVSARDASESFLDWLRDCAGRDFGIRLTEHKLVLPSDDDPQQETPPSWAVEAFWTEFASRVRPEAEVLAATAELDPAELQNVMGESLDVPADMGRCYLFFVDQHPEANWAHECAYAFVGPNEVRQWLEAQWPPVESVELTRV